MCNNHSIHELIDVFIMHLLKFVKMSTKYTQCITFLLRVAYSIYAYIT